jgi:glycosyltransferase involved in cell wall biosynthesis
MKTAVILPCYNEQNTIGKVVRDFRSILPDAQIFVIDNNSTDDSASFAKNAGASVMHERRQGKGYVIQSMSEKIDADIYVLADGDDTYPAEVILTLMEPVVSGKADMVVGSRLAKRTEEALTTLHHLGNWALTTLLNLLFGVKLKDVLSGYRVMCRDLVKNVPFTSPGFEIEAELTIQALENGYRIQEIDIDYQQRPLNSHSKLRTFRDGFRIGSAIVLLLKDYKPLAFFFWLAAVFEIMGLAAGIVVVAGYLQTGKVYRFPLAIFSVGAVLFGMLLFINGFIADTVNRRFNELRAILKKSE